MTPENVRLVASDLDGTLLAPGAVVSERTAEVLRAVRERGVEVVAVTGRSHWSSLEILGPLGCIRWFICSNGATVYDAEAGDIVHERTLSDDQIDEVVARATDAFPSVGVAWESSAGIFHTTEWIRNRRAIDPAHRPVTTIPVTTLDAEAGPIRKLMLAHDELTTYDWLEALSGHLPDGIHASTSGATFVEITQAEANKGFALEHLCQALEVAQHQTIAFGDHANDLTMLAWAGTSFAMANADPRVLAVADRTAPHHADDGVAQILEQLL